MVRKMEEKPWKQGILGIPYLFNLSARIKSKDFRSSYMYKQVKFQNLFIFLLIKFQSVFKCVYIYIYENSKNNC